MVQGPVWQNGPFLPVSTCGRVLVARCEPEGVNVGLVVGQARSLLVDVGTHPQQGAALRAVADDVAARLGGAPVGVAVVTHDHYDHWFGLAGVPDLEAWAQERLGEPTGESAGWLPRAGLAAAPLPAGRIPDGGRVELELGGLTAVVEHHGAAHTPTDLTVHVPGADVLFVGDLVEESGPVQHGPESDLAGWSEVLGAVLDRLTTRPVTRVVPGHGDVVDADFVRAQRSALPTP